MAGVCMLAAAIGIGVAYRQQREKRRKIDAQVFAEMRKNPWDLNGDLLWGYYFTNSARWPLQVDAWVLKMLGYRTVEIYPAETKGFWWLHVEKVERLTLDRMAGRNVRFAWFARVLGLSTYDGWDVGQVGIQPGANKAADRMPGSNAPGESGRP